jgi:hypothetical protein
MSARNPSSINGHRRVSGTQHEANLSLSLRLFVGSRLSSNRFLNADARLHPNFALRSKEEETIPDCQRKRLSDDLPVGPQRDRSRHLGLAQLLDLGEGLSKRSKRSMNRSQDGPLLCFAQGVRGDPLRLELRRHPALAKRNEILAHFIQQGQSFAHIDPNPRVLVGPKPAQNSIDVLATRGTGMLDQIREVR